MSVIDVFFGGMMSQTDVYEHRVPLSSLPATPLDL